MSAYAASQNTQQAIKRLTEERYFDVPPRRAVPLIKAAVEEATGTTLVELADGMWEGRIDRDGGYREVTVRAMPTESGTNVEISLEDHASVASTTLWISALILVSFLIIPLIFMIAHLQRRGRDEAKGRLIQMHRTWKEIASALGAPKRSSYREAPRRVYAPAEERRDRAAEREAAAEAEAAAEVEAIAAEQEREAQDAARV